MLSQERNDLTDLLVVFYRIPGNKAAIGGVENGFGSDLSGIEIPYQNGVIFWPFVSLTQKQCYR